MPCCKDVTTHLSFNLDHQVFKIEDCSRIVFETLNPAQWQGPHRNEIRVDKIQKYMNEPENILSLKLHISTI